MTLAEAVLPRNFNLTDPGLIKRDELKEPQGVVGHRLVQGPSVRALISVDMGGVSSYVGAPLYIGCYEVAANHTVVLVDWASPDTDQTMAYLNVVESLRSHGREIVAEDLLQLLQDAHDEGEEDSIRIYSLRSMAKFLLTNKRVRDPVCSADPMDGIMQAEWHIYGDGLLVLAFLGEQRVHCVAQADPPYADEMLDVNEELHWGQVLERYDELISEF